MSTRIHALVNALQALGNLTRRGDTANPWMVRHRDTIKRVMDAAPSGAGIDCGTKLDIDAHLNMRDLPRIAFGCSFHHMNDAGYYDGWTDHIIYVRPAWDGIDISISGPNRNDIKSYLHDVYREWLSAESD